MRTWRRLLQMCPHKISYRATAFPYIRYQGFNVSKQRFWIQIPLYCVCWNEPSNFTFQSELSFTHTHWNESPFSLLKWRDLMIHFDCSVKTFAVCGGHTDRFNCPYSVHFSVDSLLAIWAWQVPQLLFSEAFWLKHHRFVLLFCLNSFLSVFVWLMGNEVFYHI